jgi:hypothetical protein
MWQHDLSDVAFELMARRHVRRCRHCFCARRRLVIPQIANMLIRVKLEVTA